MKLTFNWELLWISEQWKNIKSIGSHIILLSLSSQLDDQLVSLPLGLNSQLMVFCSGQRAVVKTAVGITLTFDWHSTVHVKLPSPYQGAVCGLCGNYNAMPQDDLTMRDSHPAPDATWLGENWRVALVPGCSSGCQGT